MGAVELLVFEERINAATSSAVITTNEIAVRNFSARVHAEAAASGLPKLLLCVEKVVITLLPKLCLQGCQLEHRLSFRIQSMNRRSS